MWTGPFFLAIGVAIIVLRKSVARTVVTVQKSWGFTYDETHRRQTEKLVVLDGLLSVGLGVLLLVRAVVLGN